MISLSDLGKKLKGIRESLGFSQEFVARHLKTNRQAIIAIESGRRKVDSFELFKMAGLYNVSVEELMLKKEPAVSGFKEAVFHLRKGGELTDEELEKLLEFQKICDDYEFLKTL